MKKLLKILFFISLFSFVSCSKFKKILNKVRTGSSETAQTKQEGADFIVDADNNEDFLSEDEDLTSEEITSVPKVELTEEIGEHTVLKNETLMLIAFNIYGDYRKWKDIKDMNNLNESEVSEGMVLKYKKPAEDFTWDPKGLPHLVKKGESLVSISQEKYQTPKRWRSIYKNNWPLIRDPNLIFAGFTIYYIPLRDLASQ